MGPGVLWEATMFALFSMAFSGIFIAFGIAAVIGHVLLIDLLLRPTSVTLQGASEPILQAQPAR
jgi:hypothetical protein